MIKIGKVAEKAIGTVELIFGGGKYCIVDGDLIVDFEGGVPVGEEVILKTEDGKCYKGKFDMEGNFQ